MTSDPKTPPEPGSPESLGLTRQDTPAEHAKTDEKDAEEKGEPFDGNFA